MKPTGLPRKVMAVYADGLTKTYDSVADCSKGEGVTPQYICRICRNPDKPFQSENYHPTRFRYVEQLNNTQDMAEYNNHAYIACAREFFYLNSIGKTINRSELCNKYHISANWGKVLSSLDTNKEYTDSELLSMKEQMLAKQKESDAIRRKQPQEAEDFAKLINLLRSIDAKLETIANAMK